MRDTQMHLFNSGDQYLLIKWKVMYINSYNNIKQHEMSQKVSRTSYETGMCLLYEAEELSSKRSQQTSKGTLVLSEISLHISNKNQIDT